MFAAIFRVVHLLWALSAIMVLGFLVFEFLGVNTSDKFSIILLKTAKEFWLYVGTLLFTILTLAAWGKPLL